MKVLLTGEAWMKSVNDYKGCDFTSSGYYEESAAWIKGAFEKENIDVTYLPTPFAQRDFPDSAGELQRYDAVFLSDIGSNTLLLHPETMNQAIVRPNRLKVIKEYVATGGGFAMIGGWMSFQGLHGKANYHDSEIEEILPVEIMPYDDRKETPEGSNILLVQKDHPILAGIDENWPVFLGYNKLGAKHESVVLARCNRHVFMAAWQYEKGRTFAFASDCAPHWATPEFLHWSYYSRFWSNAVKWLAGES